MIEHRPVMALLAVPSVLPQWNMEQQKAMTREESGGRMRDQAKPKVRAKETN